MVGFGSVSTRRHLQQRLPSEEKERFLRCEVSPAAPDPLVPLMWVVFEHSLRLLVPNWESNSGLLQGETLLAFHLLHL